MQCKMHKNNAQKKQCPQKETEEGVNMKLAIILQLAFIFLVFIKSTQGFCILKTQYTASEELKMINHTDDNGGMHACTLEISPPVRLKNGYFLEISWQKFHFPSDMPDCKDFFIEIFLTRKYKNIGRFCSKNIGGALPFNIYSADGHVKIYYYVGKKGTKTAFELSYVMKANDIHYLRPSCSQYRSIGKFCSKNIGGVVPFNMYSYDGHVKIYYHVGKKGTKTAFELSYTMMDTSKNSLDALSCSAVTERSGEFYSREWPNEDDYSYVFSCPYYINVGSFKETKIIFMDVDLAKRNVNSYCGKDDNDDNLEIRYSSSTDFSAMKVVKSQICSSQNVTTSYKYISIKFHRKISKVSGNRGFVAGYIVYDKGGLSAGQIAGIACGVIAAIIFTVVFLWCISHRKRAKRAVRRSATVEQERTADNQNPVVNEQPEFSSNFNLTAGAVPTSVDRPPPYTPSPVLHHVTTSPQGQAFPNEPPPSYDDAILLQPMGVPDGNFETRTATTTTSQIASTLPPDSANDR